MRPFLIFAVCNPLALTVFGAVMFLFGALIS
jgi:hypothetical protein